MNTTDQTTINNPLLRMLLRSTKVEAHEVRAAACSFLMAFLLMGSYYILRPVRDAMASDWTDAEVSFLWDINFLISASIVAIYGLTISHIRLKNVVPVVYGFFALSFVSFYLLVSTIADRDLVDKTFYVWVSVFAMFHISVFWSFMSDTFRKTQAERLFAMIGSGASLGAIVGPSIPTLFASMIGTDMLLLIASTGLLLVIPLVLYIYYLKVRDLDNADVEADLSAAKMGGRWWAGFQHFVTNPYLLGIGIFILLYVFVSTFIYFEQKHLLAEYTRAERTQILGGIDWLINVLTFGLAFFATSRIVTRFGMPVTLVLVPILVVLALGILALAPLLTVLLALQVARRSGNFAITRPAREMLFTQITQEERFKAKPVVDIVVYRGGDAVSSDIYAWFSEGLGLSIAVMAMIGAGVAAAWGAVGVQLGRMYNRLAYDQGASAPGPVPEPDSV